MIRGYFWLLEEAINKVVEVWLDTVGISEGVRNRGNVRWGVEYADGSMWTRRFMKFA